jgi:mannosyltransferase
MALTPAVSYYAQTARSYALVLACVTGSTLALLRALEAEAGPGAGARMTRRWLRGRAGARALIWLPGVAICLCALVLQLAPQQRIRTPQSRLFDFGGPARYVAANARGGDGILFLTSFYRKARLGYPREFEKTSDFALAAAPVQTGTFRGRDKPFEVIRPLMLARRRIWVVGRLPSALLGVGPAREESMVLLDRFRLLRERRFRGIVVTLWLRRQDLLR